MSTCQDLFQKQAWMLQKEKQSWKKTCFEAPLLCAGKKASGTTLNLISCRISLGAFPDFRRCVFFNIANFTVPHPETLYEVSITFKNTEIIHGKTGKTDRSVLKLRHAPFIDNRRGKTTQCCFDFRQSGQSFFTCVFIIKGIIVPLKVKFNANCFGIPFHRDQCVDGKVRKYEAY